MPNFGIDSQREKVRERKPDLPEKGARRNSEPRGPSLGSVIQGASLFLHFSMKVTFTLATSGALTTPFPSHKNLEPLSPLQEGLSLPGFLLQSVSFGRGSGSLPFTWPYSESTPTPTLTERKCNPCVWDRGLLIHHSVSLSRRDELASLCIPWDSGSRGPALHP